MKWFFFGWAALCAILWFVAAQTVPSAVGEDGRQKIYWSTDANPARSDQIAPFEQAHPDIDIVVEPNTFDKTIVQSASGVGPDLIEIYSYEHMVAYVQAGILLDLTPYAGEMGFGPGSTYEKLRGSISVDGRQYRYPANAASNVIIYNKTMFDEAGIPYPTDGMLWEDFIELTAPLTQKQPGREHAYEQFALVMSKGNAKDLLLQWGATFFNEDGTRCTLDSPEAIAAMEFYRGLMKDHEVIPTPDAAESLSAAGGWGFGEIRWFASEKAAMIWGARWMFVIFRQYPEEFYENLDVVLLPHPPGGTPKSFSGARGPGINARSENIEQSLQFLQYLASEEYAEIIAMSSDGMPPSADYAEDPQRLLNPEYPHEDFQEKFLQSMRYAESMEISPFISPFIVERVWTDAIDYISNDLKTPEEALRDAAQDINDRIAQNLKEQPHLREKWDRITGAASK